MERLEVFTYVVEGMALMFLFVYCFWWWKLKMCCNKLGAFMDNSRYWEDVDLREVVVLPSGAATVASTDSEEKAVGGIAAVTPITIPEQKRTFVTFFPTPPPSPITRSARHQREEENGVNMDNGLRDVTQSLTDVRMGLSVLEKCLGKFEGGLMDVQDVSTDLDDLKLRLVNVEERQEEMLGHLSEEWEANRVQHGIANTQKTVHTSYENEEINTKGNPVQIGSTNDPKDKKQRKDDTQEDTTFVKELMRERTGNKDDKGAAKFDQLESANQTQERCPIDGVTFGQSSQRKTVRKAGQEKRDVHIVLYPATSVLPNYCPGMTEVHDNRLPLAFSSIPRDCILPIALPPGRHPSLTQPRSTAAVPNFSRLKPSKCVPSVSRPGVKQSISVSSPFPTMVSHTGLDSVSGRRLKSAKSLPIVSCPAAKTSSLAFRPGLILGSRSRLKPANSVSIDSRPSIKHNSCVSQKEHLPAKSLSTPRLDGNSNSRPTLTPAKMFTSTSQPGSIPANVLPVVHGKSLNSSQFFSLLCRPRLLSGPRQGLTATNPQLSSILGQVLRVGDAVEDLEAARAALHRSHSVCVTSTTTDM